MLGSVIKYAVGLLGVPALVTAVGMASTGKKALEKTTKTAMSMSAGTQMLPEENWLAQQLRSVMVQNAKGKYGEDYAYFTLSDYDGALKMLDSGGPGDLYFIEYDGQKYFVYSKYGLAIQHMKSVGVLSQLNKRGETVSSDQMTEFLRPVADALVQQQKDINSLLMQGAQPF